jgi:uncharacterized protein (DUF302 family)
MITKPSPYPVGVTLDRLEKLLRDKGIGIVARVDHAAAARKVGMSLRPTEVLIFGNPRLGTPLMQANPSIGLDLPLRVLAWEDESGAVRVGYTAPADLAARHGMTEPAGVLEQMTAVLDALTTQATAP